MNLGALNKDTGEYVTNMEGNKIDDFMCPDCDKDLTFCRGKIKSPYFRHKNDKTKKCNYYNNAGESQFHKEAKLRLKKMIEKKIKFFFVRKCDCCNMMFKYKIKEINNKDKLVLEKSFKFNGIKQADVAYMSNNKIRYIFEICNTHKTHEKSRPEGCLWFEINAYDFLKKTNDFHGKEITIKCERLIKCNSCIKCDNIALNIYVRKKLEQNYSEKIIVNECKNKEKNNKDWLEINDTYDLKHLRIDFNAETSINNNKNIIEKFNVDFNDYRCLICSRKGSIYAYIFTIKDYNNYDFWGKKYQEDGVNGNLNNSVWSEDLTSYPTVTIIEKLIKKTKEYNTIRKIEEEKIQKKKDEQRLKIEKIEEEEREIKYEEYRIKREKEEEEREIKYEEYRIKREKEEEEREKKYEEYRIKREKEEEEIRIKKEKNQQEQKKLLVISFEKILNQIKEKGIIEEKKEEEYIRINTKNQLKKEFEKLIIKRKCKCGIELRYICACKNPKYINDKFSNNMYCDKCNKWKCRCNECKLKYFLE